MCSVLDTSVKSTVQMEKRNEGMNVMFSSVFRLCERCTMESLFCCFLLQHLLILTSRSMCRINAF